MDIDGRRGTSDTKQLSFIISDLNEDGQIIWKPTEIIEKSGVNTSDFVEEKMGGKSIKYVLCMIFKELKIHGMIYFLILVPILQFLLRSVNSHLI